MAELLWPAVDSTHRGGPTLVLDTPELVVLPPVPPIDPDPGDPDAPPPTPVTLPPAYYLWGRRDGRLAPFLSVAVDSFTVAELGPSAEYRHSIRVAGTDQGWSMLGAPTDADGNPRYAEVLDSIEWELWCDGEMVAEGRSAGSVEAGPAVDLAIIGGGAVWRDRYLGDGGVQDLLGGIGSFHTPNLTGWSFGPGVEHRWQTGDAFDGGRCLEVRGRGWVRTPYGAALVGSTATNTQITSVVMVNLPPDPGDLVGLIVRTEVHRFTTGDQVNPNWSEAMQLSSDPEVDDWQAVEAPGRLPRLANRYAAKTAMLVNSPAEWIRVDAIRQVTRGMTGSHTEIPLEDLLRRVVARAQSEQCGGRLGVTVQVHEPTGQRAAMRWEHSQDPMVGDALSSVCDRSDGPDAWFTPDKVLHVSKRAGRDRHDLVLNRDTVITARLTSDPSLRYMESRVQVGHGGGPSRQVIGSNRREAGVIPRRHHELAPTELSYRTAEPWAAGFAEVLALRQQAVDAVVPDWYGRAFGIGDRVAVGLTVEGLAVQGWLRVVRITSEPADHTRTLTCVVDTYVDPVED